MGYGTQEEKKGLDLFLWTAKDFALFGNTRIYAQTVLISLS